MKILWLTFPDDVPDTPEASRTFLRRQKGMAEYKALRNHFQQAMSELHYVPEVQLLERASAALGDNSTRLEVLKPFHSLCFNLVLKAADVEIPPELKGSRDLEEGTVDDERQKRGCVKPTRNNFRELCSKESWSGFVATPAGIVVVTSTICVARKSVTAISGLKLFRI